MGLIFGFGLGIAIAFSLEFIDNTIKTVNDIERKNLTVLGIIPSIGEEQYQNKSICICVGATSTILEALASGKNVIHIVDNPIEQSLNNIFQKTAN